MKTTTTKPQAPNWYVVDAAGERLGRLATRIAHVLNGKHKVTFSPHQVMSDHVIVLNAEKIILMGNKADEKEYVRHSGHLGHLKRIPFSRMFKKSPEKVLERSIRGMIPRNKLRDIKMKHLHVFKGTEHTHEAQKPKPLEEVSQSQSPSPSTNKK